MSKQQPTLQPVNPWQHGDRATLNQQLTPQKRFWLTRPGALTAGLRKLGNVKLEVIREFNSQLNQHESWMIQDNPGAEIWVREIIMSIDNVPSVIARSFCLSPAAQQQWRAIRGLGQRPLADLLYQNPAIQRSPFYICQLDNNQPLFLTVQHRLKSQTPDVAQLYARCSTFWYNFSPLLVAECFLPGFWDLNAH